MKRLILVLVLLIAGALIPTRVAVVQAHTASKKAFPVTIVDDLKNRVVINKLPKRIVSLDPRDTETLFALGLEGRIVGDGTHGVGGEGATGINRPFKYPSEWPSPWGRDYPVRAKTLPEITGGCCGTPWNVETIVSLRPDIIFSLNSDLPTIQKMRALNLKVVVLDPANFNGIVHDINLVATATGARKQAAVVTGNMKRSVSSIRKQLAHVRSHPRTYYELDASNPTQPYTAGQGTFIDEAIRLAGGKNVADGIAPTGTPCPGKDCYFALALDALIQLDPQVIILGDSNYGTTVAGVKSRAGWSSISAVRSGKIYPFNDELISRAGPRIVIGIQKIARLVHPEAFKKR